MVSLGHSEIRRGLVPCMGICAYHYNDVMVGGMASQITSLTIVYSTVYSRRRSKKTSKLRVTGLCAWNSPATGEFPAQMASNTENVSIWWRYHARYAYAYKSESGRLNRLSKGCQLSLITPCKHPAFKFENSAMGEWLLLNFYSFAIYRGLRLIEM